MELKYIVYITINLCNGKFYIGVHKTNPEVFDGYIGDGIYRMSNIKPNRVGFHKAVKKYGYENFRRTTIKCFPGTEDGMKAAYELEAQLVNKTLLASKSVYNIAAGGKGSMNLESKKTVYMFSVDGKFIKKFDSAMDAVRELQLSDNVSSAQRAIRNNCLKISQSAFGYYWSYKKKFERVSSKVTKKVSQYTMNGKFLRYFDSITEAEFEIGIENIYQAIEKKVSSGNYQWKYYNGDTSDIEPLLNFTNHFKNIPIVMYDKKGNLIAEYESVEKCIIENTKLQSGQINRVLKGLIKSHKGYVFKYKDEDMI